MSTLYEIDKAIFRLINDGFVIDDETGEVLWEEENLEELITDRNTKWENIGLFMKNLDAECKAIKTEEQALKERRQTKERQIERLGGYLQHSMEALGDRKFETTKVVATLRKSNSVTIEALEKIPKEYIKTKTEISADKVAIKKALKDGEEVCGARLDEYNNLTIK